MALGMGRLEAAARLGFAARGVMYVLIGWLALRTGRGEDGPGVIDYLGSGAGRLLVAGMAAGFFGYGAWRLLDAWADASGRGGDAKALVVRAGGGASGLLHLGLGAVALLHALGGGGGGGGEAGEQSARAALGLPGGWIALLLAAAALLAAGLHQLGKAWTADFLRRLAARAAARGWIEWLGRAGFAARGIVFLIVAWFFWRAAMAERSNEAGGLGEALAALPASLRALVAAGLLLFGLFSFVEARYRRIATPHLSPR